MVYKNHLAGVLFEWVLRTVAVAVAVAVAAVVLGRSKVLAVEGVRRRVKVDRKRWIGIDKLDSRIVGEIEIEVVRIEIEVEVVFEVSTLN